MAAQRQDKTDAKKIKPPPNVYITKDVTDGSIKNDNPPSQYVVQSPIDGTIQNSIPPSTSYIKAHKNLSFSYVPYFNTFQHGTLGRTDSYLMGILHLNYEKLAHVKNIHLNIKGYEKTSWTKNKGRSKLLFKGEQVVINQSFKIWEPPTKEEGEILNFDVPFKIKLPYNLPDTLTTKLGSVFYILRAIILLKGGLVSSTHTVEILCPLKRTMVLTNDKDLPMQFQGDSDSLNYTFILPPGKNINTGVFVSIPMRLRFVIPGVSLERIEVSVRTLMKFRCNTQETCRLVKRSAETILSRQELKYLKLEEGQYRGDCVATVKLWVPRKILPTYYGRFITILHVLIIKFVVVNDRSGSHHQSFHVEENINIANIHKNFDVELPSVPAPTRFLNPRAFSLYPTTSDDGSNGLFVKHIQQNLNDTESIISVDRTDIDAAYAIVNQLYHSHMKRQSTSLDLPPSFLYDGSVASKFPPIVHPLSEQPPVNTLFTTGRAIKL